MSQQPVEMPEKRNSSPLLKGIIILLVLALAGGAAWYVLRDTSLADITDTARDQLETALGSGEPDPADTGEVLAVVDVNEDAGPVVAVPPLGRVEEGIVQPPEGYTPLEIITVPPVSEEEDPTSDSSASLDLESRSAGQDSSASLNLTPEERAALTTASGRIADNSLPADLGLREDSVVSWEFVKDMAYWLTASYQPTGGNEGAENASGYSTATLMGANIRYGNALTGLRHMGNDPIRGRQDVLQYAYTPGMLDALQRLYGNLFIQALHQAASENGPEGRLPLNRAQERDMYRVYANLFRQLASSMRGVATLDNLPLQIAEVEAAEQRAVQASSVFAEALFSYEEKKEDASKAEADKLQQAMVDSAQNSEKAMEEQGRARQAMATAIRAGADGPTLGDDALIYLAKWVARRGVNANDATTMGAQVIQRMADQLAARAEEPQW